MILKNILIQENIKINNINNIGYQINNNSSQNNFNLIGNNGRDSRDDKNNILNSNTTLGTEKFTYIEVNYKNQTNRVQVFREFRSNNISEVCQMILNMYIKNDINKTSTEKLLKGLSTFSIKKDGNENDIYLSVETLIKKLMEDQDFDIQPKQKEIYLESTSKISIKKFIYYNDAINHIKYFFKSPLKKILLPFLKKKIIKKKEVYIVEIGIYSDAYSVNRSKLSTMNVVIFILNLPSWLLLMFFVRVASLKNERNVKYSSQTNFQKVLEVLLSNLLIHSENEIEIEINGITIIILVKAIFGDNPGLALLLNISYFSKNFGGCHTCLISKFEMGNFKHSFEERPTLKDSKDAKCIYKMNNDLLKEELLDVYGLRENLGKYDSYVFLNNF
ncbi:hypothetical protein ACTFIR_012061 [Dictyostelium discoideum]